MRTLFTILDVSLSASGAIRTGDMIGGPYGPSATVMITENNSTTEPRLAEGADPAVLTRTTTCTNCGVEGSDLYFCPCYQAQYCSTECQSVHWASHKQNCGHGRRKPQLALLSCTYCNHKSYTLRRCPCGYALYCDRKCQIDDWPHHEGICTGSGILKTNSFTHSLKRVDVGVQTQNDAASPAVSSSVNGIIPLRNNSTSRTGGIRIAHFSERITDTEDGHRAESIATVPNGSVGVSNSCLFQPNRSNEALRAPLKILMDSTTHPFPREGQPDSSFIDFDRVDCESEVSTDREGSSNNGGSLRPKEDHHTRKRSLGDPHRSIVFGNNFPINSSNSNNNPLHDSATLVENPLIVVPIRTTFDTLPGLANYLASQNKDNGTIVVLASFANSIAEETAARREISQANKREWAEIMRRFVLGRVRIALSEMNAEEEKYRKEILTDSILWRRKIAYPAYKDLQRMLIKLYYRQ
ncbi:putative zinc finger protein [Trypanosoma theileri]|uniref:Putative zinc finger protein n=1 Tax=Trypanosoma theileri TaxID=67003 RepID=A0A1X0P3Z0_9TRYP|nr:putative zinc finger protein [Trypanosoma theileri]ORC91585.1 putative zinc finger protein [Trypanosoma theileri]